MKIVSWNILHGGGSRVDDLVEIMSQYQADVICLQEFRHGRSKIPLVSGLKEAGFVHTYLPTPGSNRKNTIAVFVRSTCTLSDPQTIFAESDGTARCAIVRCQLETGEPVNVIAVSLPHKKAQIPVFESLLDLPSLYLDGRSVLIGDFNCGIPFEDSQTRSFYATHLFQALLRQGWIDSWRSRNPKAREFTWFSTQKGNGFRYDHALVSPAIDATMGEVRYDHEPREQGVSDHSVLILESI